MSVLERRVKDCKATSPYLRYASNITSQGGEDGIIEAIFNRLPPNTSIPLPSSSTMDVPSPPPPGLVSRRWCVDIGAWDGHHLSNTYSLAHDRGWSALLVEADEERCASMHALYANVNAARRKEEDGSGNSSVTCLNQLVDITGPNSLVAILDTHCKGTGKGDVMPPDFDFLSIDVDGADYHLWNSLRDTCYRPAVVCIEFNPTIQNNVYFIQAADMRVQQGSSLLALTELGDSLGYTIIVTTLFNAFFVRNDLAHYCEPYSTSLDDLHSSSMITDMFQTYDGVIKLAGPRKLMWHKLSMNPERMQPLTKKQQRFLFRPGAVPGLLDVVPGVQVAGGKGSRPRETVDIETSLLRVNELVVALCRSVGLTTTTTTTTISHQCIELRQHCFIILRSCCLLLPLAHCQGLVIEVCHIMLGLLSMLARRCRARTQGQTHRGGAAQATLGHKGPEAVVIEVYRGVLVRVTLILEWRGNSYLGGCISSKSSVSSSKGIGDGGGRGNDGVGGRRGATRGADKEAAVMWLKLAYHCLLSGNDDADSDPDVIDGGFDGYDKCVTGESFQQCHSRNPCAIKELSGTFGDFADRYVAWRNGGGYTALDMEIDLREGMMCRCVRQCFRCIENRLATAIADTSVELLHVSDSLRDNAFETLCWARRGMGGGGSGSANTPHMDRLRLKILSKLCSSYGIKLDLSILPKGFGDSNNEDTDCRRLMLPDPPEDCSIDKNTTVSPKSIGGVAVNNWWNSNNIDLCFAAGLGMAFALYHTITTGS